MAIIEDFNLEKRESLGAKNMVDRDKGETLGNVVQRPLLLDLFCGIGGAAKGYERAGFDIIGVDWKVMPEYPYPIFRADALDFMRSLIYQDFKVIGNRPAVAAIHASPPCRRFSTLSKSLGYESHTDLLTPIRELLQEAESAYGNKRGKKLPWIIENVPGAPMQNPIILCGSMFDLKIERGYLQRHRLFESNVSLMVPGPCNHTGQAIGVYGRGRGGGVLKERTANAQEARDLMGIDWAGRDGVTQAIPPAYTKYLGKQLLASL